MIVRHRWLTWCVGFLIALSWFSCRPQLRPVRWTWANALKQVRPPELADDSPPASLRDAVTTTLARLQQLDPAQIHHLGPQPVSNQKLRESLADFQAKLEEIGWNDAFFRYLRENFLFYRSVADPVLFTGYYEPLLRGSLQRSDIYAYPLYRRPDNLLIVDLNKYYFYPKYPDLPGLLRGRLEENNHVVPYYSRQEIDTDSKLAGQNLELLWVDSLVDLFFLQIQGSGIVELDSGERLRIGYADQNGQPYRSIGRFLIDSGALTKDQGSMQAIKQYLNQHPEKWPEVLNLNPSYIFFRALEGNEPGPIGSLGVPLTPGRSVATDLRLFPPGALAFIECEKPVFDDQKRILRWEKFRRFVLNQDTGGAIRGPDRVDLFTGNGEMAELIAGQMKQPGALYFLIKK